MLNAIIPAFLKVSKYAIMQQLKNLIVLPIYSSSITKSLVDEKQVDTRKFYKVLYIISGSVTLSLNDRRLVVSAGSIFFKQPGEHLYFHEIREAEGFFCLLNFDYLIKSSPYLVDMSLLFPFYASSCMHIHLNNKQSEIVTTCFEKIINEEREGLIDKKQASILHLQMIILQCKRASKGYVRKDLSCFTYLN